MNFSADFHIRLKESMQCAGVSQKRLAELTGVKQSALSTYCAGKGLPSAETLYLLSRELGVSMSWLIAGTNQTSEFVWKQRALEAENRAQQAESKLSMLKSAMEGWLSKI